MGKLSVPIDIWSAGATIYQMATDRFLFCGDSNNTVVHEMLELCGAHPDAESREGECSKKHFDDNGDFLLHPTPDRPTLRTVPITKFSPPPRPIRDSLRTLLSEAPAGVPADRHQNLVEHLADLLTDCMKLVPGSRCGAQTALNHRFFGKRAGDAFADLEALWSKAENKDKLAS